MDKRAREAIHQRGVEIDQGQQRAVLDCKVLAAYVEMDDAGVLELPLNALHLPRKRRVAVLLRRVAHLRPVEVHSPARLHG